MNKSFSLKIVGMLLLLNTSLLHAGERDHMPLPKKVMIIKAAYYSAAVSGSFTKNNCPAGFTGSSVTYTVPAGSYGSDISQADADAQALNDLNTNGQIYANMNGSCTP